MLHKHNTEIDAEDVFYLLVKTHPPYWHPSGLFQYVCVATNEALRFSCVVSFEATHFLFSRKMRGENINEREGKGNAGYGLRIMREQ